MHVEIGDRAQAVAAQLQRIGELAEAVLADVEHVLPRMAGLRRTVRHHHLRQCHAPHDAAAAEADLVQGDRLARIEPDDEFPTVPANDISVEGKARPLGLHDVQRFQRRAKTIEELLFVIMFRHRHRHHAVVVDAQHPVLVQVDDGVQTLDRMRVEIVVRPRPQPAECVQQEPILFARHIEIAGRPGIDADQAHVGDAAPRTGRDEIRIAPDDLLHRHELLQLDQRSRAGHERPRQDFTRRQRHDEPPDPALAGAEHAGPRLTRRGGDAWVCRRLVQLDGLEQHGVAKAVGGADDRDDGADLGRR